MLPSRVRLFGLLLVSMLAIVSAISAALPKKYAATSRVLLPAHGEASAADFVPLAAARDISVSANGGSRVMLIQHVSSDPRHAAAVVNDFVAANTSRNMVIVDRASVPRDPVGPGLALQLLFGAAGAALLGAGLLAFRERRPSQPKRRAVERPALTPAPQPPVLGQDKTAYDELCRELLSTWFSSHRMLAIVGTGERSVRANVAARLAIGFAELGEKTLLVDAGSSAEGVRIKPVAGVDRLFLLFAPSERLASVVTEAGRRFRVVLIDVADQEDERHPYAALAGGALIVVPQENRDGAAVQALQSQLKRVPARVVGTVLNQT